MFKTLQQRSFFYMNVVSLFMIVISHIIPVNSLFPVHMVAICTIAIAFENLIKEDIRTKVILEFEDSDML